ncbi:MAG: NAD(P)/FAD-dependent oxidoreductase [Alphaproteobacteria bacterium]|nr:MAG: NAD(P)/FAD-dependent oxidoreductase [Alphaproteobacteria bacterium]
MSDSRNDRPGLGRRGFLKLSAASVAGAATLGAASRPAAAAVAGSSARPAPLPAAKGPRVVVVGGGWSGLTMAKYLKKEKPDFDVVLLEPSSVFFSCPLSNLWLAGLIETDMLIHSYVDAARNNGYIWLQAALTDLDREKRRAYTSLGTIDYDYIVLAPGIDYMYESFGVEDPAEQYMVAQTWPAAFKPASEHLTLKGKLEDFEEGVFLLTVPPGNYRCLPGPYERACMIAAYFQKEEIPGKVVLIDPNEKPTIKAEGFLAAFSELYKDVIEYMPSTKIEGIDIGAKKVITEFEEIEFADAAIYPRVRASRLIENLGLADPNSPQLEAAIDTLRYHVAGDEHTYVTGDARPMPFSKSGNTANSEAKIVAKMIAAHAEGKEVPWQSPETICYSAVRADPLESIMVDAKYKHDGHGAGWGFTDVTMINDRSKDLGKANIEWGKGLWRDMFQS